MLKPLQLCLNAKASPIQPQIHIQSNSAALLPSLCPFVRSFHHLSNLKSQVARNKTNLLFHLVHSSLVGDFCLTGLFKCQKKRGARKDRTGEEETWQLSCFYPMIEVHDWEAAFEVGYY
ncbi:uncharacterized protein LOC115982450 [Quercus lobata]|uniref:uncharacterized protein LOC115982450 n=1 Tax=Quercus lobata TaxID=97700 RepID=UPI001248FEB5|nr:uncharacterized protein LOC115982450 [Quercus lobata]